MLVAHQYPNSHCNETQVSNDPGRVEQVAVPKKLTLKTKEMSDPSKFT